MPVRLKRAFEVPTPEDGRRLLVDRLWPRGRSRAALQLDGWRQDLAPSPDLRRWFGHDPARWPGFRARYLEELSSPAASRALDELATLAQGGIITLVYAARDEQHCGALVLKDEIERRISTR